jgi:hypothetical protein
VEVNTINNFEESYVKRALLVALLSTPLFAGNAFAGFIIDVAQAGANVTMTFNGSFTFVGTGASSAQDSNWIQDNEFLRTDNAGPSPSEIAFLGSRTPNLILFPNRTPVGVGGRLTANSFTGDKIGFMDDGRVVTGQLGTPNWTGQTYSASGTMTFNNKLVSDFINEGTSNVIQWTQLGQPVDLTNTIKVTGVPEPGSLAVFTGLVAGLSVLSLRRRSCRSRHPAGARAAVGDLRAEAIAGHACRPTPGRRRTHEDFS